MSKKKKTYINERKFNRLKQIIDMETRNGSKSIRQLSEASKKYTKNGKRISRDTIKKYSRFWKDVIWKRARGRKGYQIVSKKNYEERVRLLKKYKEMLEASYRVHIQRIIMDAFNEGREYITLPEIYQLRKEVEREARRPKVGDLFGRPQDKSAWEKKS